MSDTSSGSRKLTKYMSPIEDTTIDSKAPKPKPNKILDPSKLPKDVASAVHNAEANSIATDTKYTGLLPNILAQIAETKQPAPVAKYGYDPNFSASRSDTWNCFTNSAVTAAKIEATCES